MWVLRAQPSRRRNATVLPVAGVESSHARKAEPNVTPAMTVDAGVALSILDAAPDAMLLINQAGRIVIANQAACDLFGTTLESLVTMSVDDLLPDSMRLAHAKHRATYGRHPRRRAMGSGLELVGMRVDGSMVPVEISLSPLQIDGAMHVICAVRDVTQRRADEQALLGARKRLATTMERERIGRDLHDSVLQRLYGAGLILQAALDAEHHVLRKSAERASQEIDDTISEIRSVIFDLSDVGEPARALGEELRVIVQDMAEMHGFHGSITLGDAIDDRIASDVASALVAVVREALSNVGRHSAASTVDVALHIDALGMVKLNVVDNGKGFDPETVARGRGLDNFARRAASLGGTAQIVSAPGHGTTISWTVPAVGPSMAAG